MSSSEWSEYNNYEDMLNRQLNLDDNVAPWEQKYTIEEPQVRASPNTKRTAIQTPTTSPSRQANISSHQFPAYVSSSPSMPGSQSQKSLNNIGIAYDGSSERRLSATQASPSAPGSNSTLRMLNPRTQEFERRRLLAQTEQQRQDMIREDQEREYLRLEQQRKSRAERLERLLSEQEQGIKRQEEMARQRADREHFLRSQMNDEIESPPVPQKELFFDRDYPQLPGIFPVQNSPDIPQIVPAVRQQRDVYTPANAPPVPKSRVTVNVEPPSPGSGLKTGQSNAAPSLYNHTPSGSTHSANYTSNSSQYSRSPTGSASPGADLGSFSPNSSGQVSAYSSPMAPNSPASIRPVPSSPNSNKSRPNSIRSIPPIPTIPPPVPDAPVSTSIPIHAPTPVPPSDMPPIPTPKTPSVPITTPPSPEPVPQSPNDGAATMVEQVTDSQGVVRSRVVRKGVEDFEFKGELGSGSYSTVLLALDKQSLRQYAVKVLDKNHIIKERKVKYVDIEKRTLNRLGDHPGIIRLYFTFQDRQSLYFVLDYAPNGELLNLIKTTGSLNEKCARYYACQLLDAIEYMHENGVIHRDLKPENILLDYKVRVKITDFGTAKLLEEDPETNAYPKDTRADSFVGTAEYVTPELLVNKQQGKSSDIWAWGCVLYQMIAAAPPFQGATQYLTFQKVSKIQYSIPPGFPFLVRDLLKHILVKASQRWSIEEIKKHEFFDGQDWSRKALWTTLPPKPGPYRPTPASIKPRGTRHGHIEPPSRARPPPSTKQHFIPTAGGLQAVNPTTVYGMPVRKAEPANRTQMKGGIPVTQPVRVSAKPKSVTVVQSRKSASVSSAAVQNKHASSSGHSSSSSVPKAQLYHPVSTSSGQAKADALRRRMQDYKINTRVTSASGSRPGTPTSPRIPGGSNISSATSSSSHDGIRPTSPSVRPGTGSNGFLPRHGSSQMESQYSSVLVDTDERIIKVGLVDVWISNHKPQPAHVKPEAGEDKKKAASNNKDLYVPDASMFSKLFSNKNKKKTVLVTTMGRLLVLNDEHKISVEVPLGVPQVEISEPTFLIDKEKRPRIVIKTYNKVITMDDTVHNHEWLDAIKVSKQHYAQFIADRERDTFNAAAAAASAVAHRRY